MTRPDRPPNLAPRVFLATMSDPQPPAIPDPLPRRSSSADLPELIQAIRARTPARILAGRAGPSYRTATQLTLRQDHAAALDAVHAQVDLERDLGSDLVQRFGLFEVTTRVDSREQYLMRPDLGPQLS